MKLIYGWGNDADRWITVGETTYFVIDTFSGETEKVGRTELIKHVVNHHVFDVLREHLEKLFDKKLLGESNSFPKSVINRCKYSRGLDDKNGICIDLLR